MTHKQEQPEALQIAAWLRKSNEEAMAWRIDAASAIERLHARVQELEASQSCVRDIAVSALLTGSRDRQDWIDDMTLIRGITQEKQG